MKTILKLLSLLLLAFALTNESSLLFAQGPGPMGRGKGPKKGPFMRPTFGEVDTNNDLKISEEELNQFRAQRMARRAAEGRRLKNAGKAPSFKELDLNKDGSLDPDEFPPKFRVKKNK